MNFIRRETQPMNLKINGVEYPAIWNYNAISIMEEYTGLMHLFTIARFKEGRFETKEFIGAIFGMLKAGGVVCEVEGNDVLAEALKESIQTSEEKDIQKQIMSIIAVQGDQPKEDDSKNAGRSHRKS